MPSCIIELKNGDICGKPGRGGQWNVCRRHMPDELAKILMDAINGKSKGRPLPRRRRRRET